MKHFMFVENGWVVAAGSAPSVPVGAIELAEPLRDTQYKLLNGELVRCEAPTVMHTRGPSGEWVLPDEQLWPEIRRARNELLRETDVAVLRMLEVGLPPGAALVDYRQALRDLPETEQSPSDIQWPTRPEELL